MRPTQGGPIVETVVLLSPPNKVIVKDAARAVKRVDSLTAQPVTEETLNELLAVSLKGDETKEKS
jgi:hypothetical protein